MWIVILCVALCGCSYHNICVSSADGNPIENALVVTYDPPYLFNMRDVGAAITDVYGYAKHLPEYKYYAIIKPGYHILMSRWPGDDVTNKCLTMHRIGELPTARIIKCRGDGKAKSIDDWIVIRHDVGQEVSMKYKAHGVALFGISPSGGELKITSNNEDMISRVDRMFWSADKGKTLEKEITLISDIGNDAPYEYFAILDKNGRVKKRIHFCHTIIGTSKDGVSIGLFFSVADMRGTEGPVEPPVFLHGEPYFWQYENEALLNFTTQPDPRGGYRGPLAPESAEAVYDEYISTYKKHVSESQWETFMKRRSIMTRKHPE